jgi:uncharacterized protein (TIGR02284 family)
MATKNEETISTLNGLIETLKDGQEGFKTAAEGVKDSGTKNLFYQYSQQRAQFVGELQAEVRRLGGDPEKSGSIAGALHRGWINIKSTVTGEDEYAVLAECERGEDNALSNYRSALEETLPSDIQTILVRQSEAIKLTHDRVRTLRDKTLKAKA